MIPETRERVSDRAVAVSSGPSGRMGSFRNRFFTPTDAAGLAVFRIGFGVISAWEVWRAYDGNQIRADFEFPPFHFRWWLFDWVRPLPGIWLYLAFAVTGVAALLVAIGLWYRGATIVHWAGISYWLLLDKVTYLNHRYLTAVFAFLLIFVPAHAAFSVDARRKPWVRSAQVPAWAIHLLRFQVGLPYFFAGVAKLNFDWLVRAEPLRAWLGERMDFPVIGRLFGDEIVVRSMAIGSAILDLSVPFLLLHRRTRAPAFALALLFHFMNARLFEIGIFPWMMIVATTIFFPPDWPRRMLAGLRSGPITVRGIVGASFVLGFVIGGFLPHTFTAVQALVGGVGTAVAAFHLVPERRRAPVPARAPSDTPWRGVVPARPLLAFLALWAVVQLVVPLRHVAIPGNVNWTEEGQRFSWHLLVHSKAAAVAYLITDPASGETWREDLRRHLTPHQVAKLNDPDMVLQFAHHLDGFYRERRRADVEVRVESIARLNGRRPQPFLDSLVDLSEVGRPYIPPADWIVPLEPYR